MSEIKTDETLLRTIREAASQPPRPKDVFNQRVSYVMGSLKRESTMTEARVREILVEQEGFAEPAE